MADGSMQRALELDNDALNERRETLLKHITSLSIDKIVTVFDASEALSGNRDETLESLDILLSIIRDVVHLSVGCGEIINNSIRPTLDQLVSRLNLERSMQIIDQILETRRSVQRNANAKLALDHLFMRFASIIA